MDPGSTPVSARVPGAGRPAARGAGRRRIAPLGCKGPTGAGGGSPSWFGAGRSTPGGQGLDRTTTITRRAAAVCGLEWCKLLRGVSATRDPKINLGSAARRAGQHGTMSIGSPRWCLHRPHDPQLWQARPIVVVDDGDHRRDGPGRPMQALRAAGARCGASPVRHRRNWPDPCLRVRSPYAPGDQKPAVVTWRASNSIEPGDSAARAFVVCRCGQPFDSLSQWPAGPSIE